MQLPCEDLHARLFLSFREPQPCRRGEMPDQGRMCMLVLVANSCKHFFLLWSHTYSCAWLVGPSFGGGAPYQIMYWSGTRYNFFVHALNIARRAVKLFHILLNPLFFTVLRPPIPNSQFPPPWPSLKDRWSRPCPLSLPSYRSLPYPSGCMPGYLSPSHWEAMTVSVLVLPNLAILGISI